MPIRVQNDLPVKEILEHENIFVMDYERSLKQDIRPLKIIIMNLMHIGRHIKISVQSVSDF